jgi:ABC-type nickel/cobalt efflux system permease component RcnA
MQTIIPLLFAVVMGMGHAFEPDHLLAVSTLVARHDELRAALKNGLFWGLGHTTMLVIFGGLLIFGRATFLQSGYFEAVVGLMLIGLGTSRLLDKNSYQPALPSKQRASARASGQRRTGAARHERHPRLPRGHCLHPVIRARLGAGDAGRC